ncbi:MAG TPA: TonB-dependent receptor plug domain-containing protein, partial [Thermoanaerobaculia bacterium]|nr:TonB-dependent receptor plug domain-containing protein [Thermoanaerobaculia bacterium]
MTRTALLLPAFLVAGALRAQAPPPPATFQEEILVSAPKVPLPLDETPSSATVLTAGEIALSGARTLPELLEAAGGGFHVYDFGGAGTFSAVDLRGFYSAGETSYAIVQVDGMAVNDLDTDAVDWNLVDLARIERVEVLRGPVSALYGNVGMSGLINVVTRRPGPGLGGALSAGGGEQGRAEGSATAAWGSERTALDLGVRRQEVAGWRRHSAWNGTLAQSRLQWAPESRRLDVAVQALYLSSSRDKPGAIPAGTPPAEAGTPLDREGSRSWETGLSLALPLGGDAHFEARAAARGKREEAVDTIFFLPLEHDFETASGSGELRYRRAFSLLGRGGRLLAGAEGTAGRIDGSYFAVDRQGGQGARAARINRP